MCEAACEMKRWKCHKEVHAEKIVSIEGNKLNFGDSYINVDDAYLEKHKPVVGGYYVVYDGGYQSFSPEKAFEGGYTQIK